MKKEKFKCPLCGSYHRRNYMMWFMTLFGTEIEFKKPMCQKCWKKIYNLKMREV